jgi:hypothetical protein
MRSAAKCCLTLGGEKGNLRGYFSPAGTSGARNRRIAGPRLIAVMVYSFARINSVLGMKVSDYFVQGRRGWREDVNQRNSAVNR